MAGIANSWIEQYTTVPTPCGVNPPQGNSTLSSCVLWIIVGLLLGSIRFQKGQQ